MATGKEIKSRIKSVKNTGKITKAMELISTVKMRKAQESAQGARPFAVGAAELVVALGADEGVSLVTTGKTLVLLIASNKGLCGGYNVNLFKMTAELVRGNLESYEFITAGKRAREFVARTGGHLLADFSGDISDTITPKEAKKVSRFLQQTYKVGGYSGVKVVYSHFISAINQKSVVKNLFPMTPAEMTAFLELVRTKNDAPARALSTTEIEYTLEPSRSAIREQVLPMIYDLVVLEAFLEAKASEHAARMVAMKNAKDSAGKKVKSLTLSFNKARQASITKEVSEIVSGVESMKDA